jgi:type II secretory pathway component PulC
MLRPSLLIALALTFAGCGAAPAPVARVEPPPPLPAPVEPAGVIRRADLDVILEQGPGAFLARVEIEPVMEGDAFVAFQVLALHDATMFAGVDLLPGDRLVSVNGQTIERPEHAMTVWSSLRVASELTVVVSRAGEMRALRFPIVD